MAVSLESSGSNKIGCNIAGHKLREAFNFDCNLLNPCPGNVIMDKQGINPILICLNVGVGGR